MTKAKMRWFETLKDDSCGILYAPVDPQVALDVLREYILGENWYSMNPVSQAQINTEVVHEILNKVSKQYRKDIKENML